MLRFLLILTVFAMGCETPYTGFLRPGDIDGYIQTIQEDTICLDDGFDTICVRTVEGNRGPQGDRGPQGKSGGIGTPGIDGMDGKDGISGAYFILDGPYLVLETPTEVFKVELSKGAEQQTYVTPVAEVYVPGDGGVVDVIPTRDEPIKIKPVAVMTVAPKVVASPVAVTTVAPKVVASPPVVQRKLPDDGAIWHVMYRVDGGRVTAYVYPRERDQQTTPPFDISDRFLDEIQGTREDVNILLGDVLKDGATLASVGGTQGVIDR